MDDGLTESVEVPTIGNKAETITRKDQPIRQWACKKAEKQAATEDVLDLEFIASRPSTTPMPSGTPASYGILAPQWAGIPDDFTRQDPTYELAWHMPMDYSTICHNQTHR